MNLFKTTVLAFSAIAFTSCNNDDDTPIINSTLEVPETYTFERNGESTVDFNGQNTRILMYNEMMGAFNDFGNVTEQQLLNMFNHQAGNNDFENPLLNSSDKNIRSKVAASYDYFNSNSVIAEEIKTHFENLISNQMNYVAPNHTEEAAIGKAGQIIDGESTRFVNEKGFENNQMFAKSLIGALVTDQALNNYLSSGVLDANGNRNNNDENVVEEGKPYTTMEHKFDEAYGYIYGGNVENQANPNASEKSHNSLLHGYIKTVDNNTHFAGISDKIFKAFVKGRAAIVGKDYKIRDEQIDIIQKNISKVIAIKAIYYLQAGKDKIKAGERIAGFHALSEGLGFLYSLQFSHNPQTNQPYMTRQEVLDLIDSILKDNGLWTVSEETLDMASEAIAKNFDFTVAEASANATHQ